MYQTKRTNLGTKKHLIIDEAKGLMSCVTLFDYKLIEAIEGDLRNPPIAVGNNWHLGRRRCLDDGLKVVPDQWQAPCIEIVPDDDEGYMASCTATHPLVGKRTVKAPGISVSQAKTNFWSAWNDMAKSSGVHTHLNLTKPGYIITW